MNNLIRLRDGVAEVCRDDPWQLLRELPDALPPGPLLLPLAAWLEHRGEAGAAAPWCSAVRNLARICAINDAP